MAKHSKVFGNLPAATKNDDGPKQTTREEQPLPVDIFPKDGPTEPTVEKLWGGGEHRKAAAKAIADGSVGKLLKAFPEDTALINETVHLARIA